MNSYRQAPVSSQTHFDYAPYSEVQPSRFKSSCRCLFTGYAGDIIPAYCQEVLPSDTFDMSLSFVIRQTTPRVPTMGQMHVDFYAFFVPNRIVNESWVNVMGENSSGSWVAPDVSLATLAVQLPSGETSPSANVSVPVHSVADYYGFPTQGILGTSLLIQCNDLKFRGYIEIYNERFRDQNYEPPVPYSKLNVYEGFFLESGSAMPSYTVYPQSVSSGSVPDYELSSDTNKGGALVKAIVGEGSSIRGNLNLSANLQPLTTFSALDRPFKAYKCHDYFTSVLPSPQKGPLVFVPVSGGIEGQISNPLFVGQNDISNGTSIEALNTGLNPVSGYNWSIGGADGAGAPLIYLTSATTPGGSVSSGKITGLEIVNAGLSLSDLRDAAAIQQVYEQLARSGSRYREYVRSFFGLEADDPYSDIPAYLGHIRRNLDLYQTAQTSASAEGSTPQGNLAAFGYTSNGGHLFKRTFLEHGYIHVLAVVRHKNVYASFMSRDNFRLSMLDFYQPQLANISEQPVYTREINPFYSGSGGIFGYQEAWAEYRYTPDRVSGLMRPGVEGSLSVWNFADEFDSGLNIASESWLKSNSEEVLNRTLTVTSSEAPQLLFDITFQIDMQRPMPVYSVPGLDVI